MLADFQQALADLTARPEWCIAVRADASLLRSRYNLTDREARRLHAIACDAGMSCACTVYRMNRLAPLAMNARQTLLALGPSAKKVLSEYWHDHPRGHAHFFLESDRFCTWLRARLDVGGPVDCAQDKPATSELQTILDRESDAIRVAIRASSTESHLKR